MVGARVELVLLEEEEDELVLVDSSASDELGNRSSPPESLVGWAAAVGRRDEEEVVGWNSGLDEEVGGAKVMRALVVGVGSSEPEPPPEVLQVRPLRQQPLVRQ